MKTIICVTLLIISFSLTTACLGQAGKPATIKKADTTHPVAKTDLHFIAGLDGQYPFEAKLLDQPGLKKRLPKLLGAEYRYMKAYLMDVATPIKVKGSLFYVWGMQAHSGGDFSTTLMGDMDKNVLHVILRRDQKDKTYSEDGSEPSQEMLDLRKD